jgi:hypothetical protein
MFPLLDQPLSETDATLRENRFILPRLAPSGRRHDYLQQDHRYLRISTKSHLGREEGDPKTNRLIFVKRTEGKDYVYVAEFARGKKYGERLRVVTFFKASRKGVDEFIAKNEAKKDEARMAAGISPGTSSNDRHPITSSDSTIAQENKQGHAQPLTAQVLTPSGYRPMGDIQVGDKVLTVDGSPTPVMGVYPQGRKKIYRVTLTDGRTARSTLDHLWSVREDGKNDFEALPLSEILQGIEAWGRRYEIHPLSDTAATTIAGIQP